MTDERLLDLVRYARSELHEDGLITDEEYAELVNVGSKSARRLENYDQMRNRVKELEEKLAFVAPYIDTEDGSFTFPDGDRLDGCRIKKSEIEIKEKP